MVRIFAALIALVLLLAPSAALAQKRIALLIGNQTYTAEIGRLANPHNDIALLEKTLKVLGFEVAIERDASLGALTRAVNAYARRVKAAGPGAIAFFYYAGHGASDAGTNYLIPVDVKSADDGELWDQSLQLNHITRQLKRDAGNATHFVVFDACRNNLKLRAAGSRALVQSRGFVPVAQESGMLVAYATAEGELASDVGQGAGPYAKVLAEEIIKPGVEAVTMFRNVQVRVRSTVGQEPWLGFSALGVVHLAGVEAPKPPPVSAAPAPSSPRLSEAAEAWDRAKDTTSIAALQAFVARFKDTFYADLARVRIEELTKQQVAVAAAPPHAGPPSAPTKKGSGLLDQALGLVLPPKGSCDGVEIGVGSTNERRCMKPGAGKSEWFKDCPTCPEMVVAPSGRFMMGSPASELGRIENNEEQVSVTIGKPFAVGRFAVTRGEFAAFAAATGHDGNGCWLHEGSALELNASWRSPGFAQTDRHPVVCIRWTDAKSYVAWLAKTTGKQYRLLSDAEREYATRAGTATAFWWGSSITPGQANYKNFLSDNSDPYLQGDPSQWRRATVPVDSFEANPWGLYNVHGNVWEWGEDCENKNSRSPGDGSALTSGDCIYRIMRGGDWGFHPGGLRSAYRLHGHSPDRSSHRGFRVARTLD